MLEPPEVVLLRPFFHLTSSFFGLNYQYKTALLEEIFLAMKHLPSTYSDVLSMPTGERRYFLGLLVKNKLEERQRVEEIRNRSEGHGKRSTTIGGEALKNKIKSGEIKPY